MNREQVLRKLKDCQSDLRQRFGVCDVGIFGSAARDELREDSDIDVLVEFLPDRHIGLFGFVQLQRYLEEQLNRKIDLTTRDALKRQLKDRILKEYVHAA